MKLTSYFVNSIEKQTSEDESTFKVNVTYAFEGGSKHTPTIVVSYTDKAVDFKQAIIDKASEFMQNQVNVQDQESLPSAIKALESQEVILPTPIEVVAEV